MNFDLVHKANIIMQDIPKIIEVEEGTYTTVLNAEDTTILAGIQYDKREITEKQRLKALKQLKKLEKIFKINHILINQRGVLFQGQVKERKNG